MTKIELTFALSKDEAREGVVLSARARQVRNGWSRLWSFVWQIAMAIALIVAATLFSILADHPTGNPEMLSLFVGYLACMLVWQWTWRKNTLAAAEQMVQSGKLSGPTTAVIDQAGVDLRNDFGTSRLPWSSIGKVLTAKHVSVLRFGAHSIILPHRALPHGLDALTFGKQLENWRTVA